MALDTQEKRMSATGVGRPWMRSKFPGANDQAWRIASGNAYGGNAIGVAEADTKYRGPLSWDERGGLGWAQRGAIEWQATVPNQPGLEFTMPENRMHYSMSINRMHHTMPENRMHHTVPEED